MDVDRLVQLFAGFPRKVVPLTDIREMDERWSGENEGQTWRSMIEHVRRIEDADLSFPIILSATGEVMDGRHRAAKALLLNRTDIEAVRFESDPEPDFTCREPDDLPS